MQEQPNKEKQEADEDKDPKSVKREGFSAEELGAESAYTDSTEMARQMRRGDETVPDPNDRDVVGASDAGDETKNKPVPRHQRGADDAADKNFGTKEN